MMKWLYRQNETYIDGFDFKKLKKDSGNEEIVRRQTLTNEEYNGLIKTMRRLCSEKHSRNEVELTWRKLTQMFVLVATNSGLRVSEQKQLRWKDTQVKMHKDKDRNTVKLARIVVRAATSKVRKETTL